MPELKREHTNNGAERLECLLFRGPQELRRSYVRAEIDGRPRPERASLARTRGADQVADCAEELRAQEIGNALYGLRSLGDSPEVRQPPAAGPQRPCFGGVEGRRNSVGLCISYRVYIL